MAGTSIKSLFLGFLAGAIATVTVHELVNYALLQQGLFPRVPWSMEPVSTGPLAPYAIPQIASDTFWGGLWGMVFAALWGNPPQGPLVFKGLVAGIIGPAIIGVFTLVPLLTSKFPLFFGGDVAMIWPVVVILAGFGAATGWLYGFFTSGCRLP